MVDLSSVDLAAIQGYGESLLGNSLSGDPTSIIIIAGIAIVVSALVFKVSGFLFGLIKRFFLLIVIGLSAFFFLNNFGEKLAAEGPNGQLIVVGVVGALGAIAALVIALGAFKRQVKRKDEEPKPEQPKDTAPNFTPTQLQQPQAYTTQALTPGNIMNSLKDDRSLLAVLSYVIIAQFGVFSSKTISAPNPEIGMIFFGIFIVGALLFIKTTYHNYLKGITHLVAASIFGILFSILLGVFWVELPLETLLSTTYFETDAMVAFVTGIAVSLLMGTRN
tara:strand:- start:25849 stop:26679 length:831 start_codon:yes stop_codon:yes gene_type:complete